MACNCKETAKNAGKYSDDGIGLYVIEGVEKVLVFLLRILTVLLALSLIIVILPFFLVYIAFMMILGKKVKINLEKLIKRRHHAERE